MKLNNIKIKPFYNSYENDIVNEFYNTALSEAKYYDRVSAYFNSKVLALYAKSLEKIYLNKGKVRFIFSFDITDEDFNLMKEGYSNRKKLESELENRIKYNELSDEEKVYFSNLAYLIEIGLVDIKIAFTKTGIFHEKYGLISDDEDSIYFRGSNNETVSAIMYNYEGFETTCTWNCGENEILKVNRIKDNFERLWNNKQTEVEVVEIPEIVKQAITKHSKGEFIDNIYSLLQNKFVLDLDKENNLTSKNLLNPNKIDYRDRTFKVFLKKYVKEYKELEIEFFKGLNYAEIKYIIEHLKENSKENDYELYITNRLQEYIFIMDVELEKRQKLGINIKEHNEIVRPKFEEFRNILDKEMHRKLRESQLWDAFHIVSMIRAANFSVPGAGKTSIVYGAFAYLNRKEDKRVDKIVMIGPKNSFMSWKEEFPENFGDKKTLKVLDCQSDRFRNKANLKEELKYGSANYNLILINYEKLDGLKEEIESVINERTLLVFDESHKIKAIEGVRAKAAIRISKKAKYKVCLTGTPIPNSFEDIYNTLKILYGEEYNTVFKFKPTELKSPNEIKVRQINEKVYPFYCRTTKKDLKIPAPNPPQYIVAKMNDKEKLLFDIIWKKYRKNILTLYIRLMQATCSPQLLLREIDKDQIYDMFYTDEQEEEEIRNNVGILDVDKKVYFDEVEKQLINQIDKTEKFKQGIQLVKKLAYEGKQVVVWGVFVETINNISSELDKVGVTNEIIYGATSQSDRERIISDFKNKKIKVLITNPHTLAESVSLHKTCHDAVYFEYSFNLTHMLQSRDRINRLGLKDDDYTQYYYMILSNESGENDSIDKKTLDRLAFKEKRMLDAIEGTELTCENTGKDIDEIIAILGKV